MSGENCLFCEVRKKESLLIDTKHFFVISDTHPVNKGHTLIIPKRHQPDLFSVSQDEWRDLWYAVHRTKEYLDKKFSPDGYNIVINCAEAAGQTSLHLYIHIIPHYKGGVENLHGGARNIKEPSMRW